MNETKRLCHDSSFCEYCGRKHLPVSSIVFLASAKKFDPTTSFESAIQTTSYNIVLFEATEHIFANE